MRAVVQRVKEAHVSVRGLEISRIGKGLLIFLGVGHDDNEQDTVWLAEKICRLRILSDQDDKMNLSLLDIQGGALVVSQFTLWGDCRKGRRPSFTGAAPPEKANALYKAFIAEMEARVGLVASGVFQENMEVHLVNDGPVTLLLDSRKSF